METIDTQAIRALIEHAREKYPHFESERGQRDLQNALDAINNLEHKSEYNGWTNYETWNVKLWLDNEPATQELQREMLQQAKDTPKNEVWTREETTRFTLADLLKTYLEDYNPLNDEPSMYADLLNAAISEVNWNEISDNIIQDS